MEVPPAVVPLQLPLALPLPRPLAAGRPRVVAPLQVGPIIAGPQKRSPVEHAYVCAKMREAKATSSAKKAKLEHAAACQTAIATIAAKCSMGNMKVQLSIPRSLGGRGRSGSSLRNQSHI